MKNPLWKNAREILKGKAKGSKLIILGVFLIGTGVTIHLFTGKSYIGAPFELLGFFAFADGLSLYRKEAEYELEKRKKTVI